jgi:hypothetical protein
MAQGITESVSEAARSLGSIFEEMDVMQGTAQAMAAGKVASEVVPIRSLANGFRLGSISAKTTSSDHLSVIDERRSVLENIFDGAYESDEHMEEEVDELLEAPAHGQLNDATSSILKLARDVQDESDDDDDESADDHEELAAQAHVAARRKIADQPPDHEPGQQRTKPSSDRASPSQPSRLQPSPSRSPSPAATAPPRSSPAAIVGPAAVRDALAQALQLDSTRPSVADTLDHMLATIDPSDLAAFLPSDTPAASIRATVHMARARRATADRAHELQLARARLVPEAADAESDARLYRAAVRPTRPTGLGLADLKRRVAHAWECYEQSGGALSPEHRYHTLAALLLPDEARAFRSDPAVARRAIAARPPAGECWAEREARYRGLLAALLAFCDRQPASPAPLGPPPGAAASAHAFAYPSWAPAAYGPPCLV